MNPTSSQDEEEEEVNNGQNNSNSESVLKATMNGGENEVEVNGKDPEKGDEEEEQDDNDEPPPLQDVTTGGDENKSRKKYNLNVNEEEKTANEDGWIDILENGQLLKKVLKEGADENRPQRSCKVVVSLKTKIKETGKEVPSETFENFTAFVGDYDLIHGVDLALPLMKVGEVAQVMIHPRFGYGEQGKEPDIPPSSTLDCEVHLLSSEWIDSESQLSLDERIKFGS